MKHKAKQSPPSLSPIDVWVCDLRGCGARLVHRRHCSQRVTTSGAGLRTARDLYASSPAWTPASTRSQLRSSWWQAPVLRHAQNARHGRPAVQALRRPDFGRCQPTHKEMAVVHTHAVGQRATTVLRMPGGSPLQHHASIVPGRHVLPCSHHSATKRHAHGPSCARAAGVFIEQRLLCAL